MSDADIDAYTRVWDKWVMADALSRVQEALLMAMDEEQIEAVSREYDCMLARGVPPIIAAMTSIHIVAQAQGNC